MRATKRKGARLGQHFLTGTWAARSLVAATAASAGDTVLEIGPGKGALTREILKTGARVIAVEKDSALVGTLATTFKREIAAGQLRLIAGDIRDLPRLGLNLDRYIVAANIPYYITGEIIRQLLTSEHQPYTIALLVQKEVAERIRARDGKESILSISVKVYGQPTIVAKVSRGNFAPPPSVDSAILVVSHISKEFFRDLDEKFFFKVLRAGFSSKRKKLTSNLAAWGKENVLRVYESIGLSENVRAEDVSRDQWEAIVRGLNGTVSLRGAPITV